jgi:hypothetical protein
VTAAFGTNANGQVAAMDVHGRAREGRVRRRLEHVRAVVGARLAETELPEVFQDVDSNLAAKMAGETTGGVLILGAEGLVGVSAGDSEAWVVSQKGIDDLTAGQRKRRLGSGRVQPVPFRRRSLDGVLVVGTDGLFKYATAGMISAAAVDDQVAAVADKLVSLVRLPSGSFEDDVGVVVVRDAHHPCPLKWWGRWWGEPESGRLACPEQG